MPGDVEEIEAILRKHISLYQPDFNAKSVMAQDIANAAKEVAALRVRDRKDGARGMRSRAAECARYRVERAALALQGGNDGRHRNIAARDTAQELRLEIAALPLSPARTEDGRDA